MFVHSEQLSARLKSRGLKSQEQQASVARPSGSSAEHPRSQPGCRLRSSQLLMLLSFALQTGLSPRYSSASRSLGLLLPIVISLSTANFLTTHSSNAVSPPCSASFAGQSPAVSSPAEDLTSCFCMVSALRQSVEPRVRTLERIFSSGCSAILETELEIMSEKATMSRMVKHMRAKFDPASALFSPAKSKITMMLPAETLHSSLGRILEWLRQRIPSSLLLLQRRMLWGW
mmetsp:Transcript_99958/g.283076  ORF Transcript_99958/g.283076 Transcript_99958/m.283076 type:complete len:230 (-) Transcript_99958:713-1402(-)